MAGDPFSPKDALSPLVIDHVEMDSGGAGGGGGLVAPPGGSTLRLLPREDAAHPVSGRFLVLAPAPHSPS